ncbi:MAG TPA: methylated-DNA--[protein]-cysteine S-methyltransferase [Candidatus Saccharimonadia bacterium]|nr:methylated-DNA--[protein]-cysteine S-methyltransferase [Candidatus Saccharimonadia bacterium]
MDYEIINSPIGKLMLISKGDKLSSLHFSNHPFFKKLPSNFVPNKASSTLKQTRIQIEEYFKGKRKVFEFKTDFEGTDFQKKVWESLSTIPHGQTVSYAVLASRIGKPKAVRAVGSAVGKNPIAIIVPCHRVIKSDGKIGGFSGGIDKKVYLLDIESLKQKM